MSNGQARPAEPFNLLVGFLGASVKSGTDKGMQAREQVLRDQIRVDWA